MSSKPSSPRRSPAISLLVIMLAAPASGGEPVGAAPATSPSRESVLAEAGLDARAVEAARLQVEAEAAYKEGRFGEARAGFERAAALHEAREGRGGAATLAALGRLAAALAAEGAPADALAVQQDILARASAAYGDADPVTMTAMHNVGAALLKLGRATEAIPFVARAMALRTQVFGPEHPETLQSVAEAAAVRSALGDYLGALDLDQRALAGRRAALGEEHPDSVASLNSVAEDLVSLGRFAEALPIHERAYALRRAALGPRDRLTLASLNNLTATYEYLGRSDDALKLHAELVGLYTQVLGDRHPDTLTSMSNYALALARAGRAAEAIALQERILKTRTEVLGNQHPATVAALAAISSSWFAIGRYDAALPYAERAYAAYQQLLGPDHPDSVRAGDNLATVLLYLGRPAQALPLFEMALSKYGRLLGDQHPSTIGVMPNLAALYYAGGRRLEGLALYERMLAAVERMRASGDLSPENRQALFARWVVAYKNYVQVLLVERRADRAFEVTELTKARTLLESSAVRRANQSGVLDPEESAQVEALEKRIAGLGDRVASAFDKPDLRLELETQKNAAIQELATLRRQLTQKYPKYASLTDVRLLGPGDARGLVPADAAFVSYLTLGDRVVGFVVGADGKLAGRELGTVPDLASAVEAYRAMLASAGGAIEMAAAGRRVWRLPSGSYQVAPSAPAKGAVWVKDGDELARYLGAKLVTPLRAELAGKRHWIVSPEGALTLLPFETLFDGDKRVVADHDLSYAQSLSMLGLLRAREQDYQRLGARRELFAVGGAPYSRRAAAPEPAGGTVRGASAVQQAFQQLKIEWQDLPGSEREVDGIAALFPPEQVVLLRGEAASERELAERNATRELAQFRYLLFSTHGYLSTVEPALSAVVLSQRDDDADTDGYVTASEWTRYDLQSDLIVLSACETGVGKVVQGEGVTGLPFALYVAGNRNTLLSLWPVVDESTALFMTELFRRLRAGESQVAALNAVKRQFLTDPAQRFAAPLFWAPFVLYGG